MRNFITGLALAASVAATAGIATPASAQRWDHRGNGYHQVYHGGRGYDRGYHRGWEHRRWERQRYYRHHDRHGGWGHHNRGYYGRHW